MHMSLSNFQTQSVATAMHAGKFEEAVKFRGR